LRIGECGFFDCGLGIERLDFGLGLTTGIFDCGLAGPIGNPSRQSQSDNPNRVGNPNRPSANRQSIINRKITTRNCKSANRQSQSTIANPTNPHSPFRNPHSS
jgi:hypothetical protein